MNLSKERIKLTDYISRISALIPLMGGFLALSACVPASEPSSEHRPSPSPTTEKLDRDSLEVDKIEEQKEVLLTPVVPEKIFELEALPLDNYKLSQRFVSLLQSTLTNPSIEYEDLNIDLDNLLVEADKNNLEKFLNLLGEENPQLQEKLREIIGVNNKTIVNSNLGISFTPSFVENPNVSTVLSLRYSEETGWLATLALVTNSNSGYPVGSNLKVTGDEFLVVAPLYATVDNVEQDQKVYSVLMTEEVIDVLSSNGFPQSTANRYKNQVVSLRLTADQAQALTLAGFSPETPMRQLNKDELSTKLEEIANMNALEKEIWNSFTIAEVNTNLYPELKDKYGNLGYEFMLNESVPGNNYESEVYDPERMLRFVASNLWLKYLNNGGEYMTLDEFIANMPAQDFNVVNTETQQLEVFSDLKITKIRVIATHESDDNDELVYQYESGVNNKIIKTSIQFNPDKLNEITIIVKYPEGLYQAYGYHPGMFNVQIPFAALQLALPNDISSGNTNSYDGNEISKYIGTMPGEPGEYTRFLYYGCYPEENENSDGHDSDFDGQDHDETVPLAIRIFSYKDPKPES